MKLQKFWDQIFAHQKLKENPEVVAISATSKKVTEVIEVQYQDGKIVILTQ